MSNEEDIATWLKAAIIRTVDGPSVREPHYTHAKCKIRQFYARIRLNDGMKTRAWTDSETKATLDITCLDFWDVEVHELSTNSMMIITAQNRRHVPGRGPANSTSSPMSPAPKVLLFIGQIKSDPVQATTLCYINGSKSQLHRQRRACKLGYDDNRPALSVIKGGKSIILVM